mmetsp:Transcript_6999/g.10637  ORF Transcript_6999/g.10637 Transcript_6999/m.10637 type:complete len:238 (-) Transcript_6999:96-809(-)
MGGLGSSFVSLLWLSLPSLLARRFAREARADTGAPPVPAEVVAESVGGDCCCFRLRFNDGDSIAFLVAKEGDLASFSNSPALPLLPELSLLVFFVLFSAAKKFNADLGGATPPPLFPPPPLPAAVEAGVEGVIRAFLFMEDGAPEDPTDVATAPPNCAAGLLAPATDDCPILFLGAGFWKECGFVILLPLIVPTLPKLNGSFLPTAERINCPLPEDANDDAVVGICVCIGLGFKGFA